MKCPKCGLDNPAKTRYCLRCGSILLPPVPQPEQSRPDHPRRKSTGFWVGVTLITILGVLIFFSLSIAFLMVSDQSQVAVTEIALTEDGGDSVDAWVEIAAGSDRSFEDYLDPDKSVISIPGTSLHFDLPTSYGYRFAYDQTRRQAVIEAETTENTTITLTITELTSDPILRSEIDSEDSDSIYWTIEGTDDLYYYILNPTGRMASGTLVDAKNNISVNLVYDQNLSGFDEPYEEMDEYSDESDGEYDEESEIESDGSSSGEARKQIGQDLIRNALPTQAEQKTARSLLRILESTGIQD